MSLKKDETGRRWIEVEAEVPGTPEQVWEAIATGPGVSSWFVPTERPGDGTIVSQFGPGMEAVATETAYEPPHRFAAEGPLGPPDAPKMATEWVVEARSGGTCVVRVVHSLFTSADDWDDQLEDIESGWPMYFHILRLYLTHFRGQPCTIFQLMAMSPQSADSTWDGIASALGLAGAEVGERRATPDDAPRLAGVIENTGNPGHPHQAMLRLDEPGPGFVHVFTIAMAGVVLVGVRCYRYGDRERDAAASEESAWQAWMNQQFPPPAAAEHQSG